MAHNLSFKQISSILVEIHKQATGQTVPAPVDTGSFVQVAQATVAVGTNRLVESLSQVLGKTLFSIRPYSRKLKALKVTEERFAGMMRKLVTIDTPPEDNKEHSLVEGEPIDHYTVAKPKVLETWITGGSTYQRHITIFQHQLDTAFRSPEELSNFVSMIMSNVMDMLEKDHEETSRGALTNFIGGKIHLHNSDSSSLHCVKLLSEYNAEFGKEYTYAEAMGEENYPAFMRWCIAKVMQISAMMTERTTLFHVKPNNLQLMRHTPKGKQILFLSDVQALRMNTALLSSTFHDEYLKKLNYETVSYWQSPKKPDYVSVKPNVMGSDGIAATANAVTSEHVFAVLLDCEAVFSTTINQWTATTPLNAAGGYHNLFWHYTERYGNDFTENGVVFVIE